MAVHDIFRMLFDISIYVFLGIILFMNAIELPTGESVPLRSIRR